VRFRTFSELFLNFLNWKGIVIAAKTAATPLGAFRIAGAPWGISWGNGQTTLFCLKQR
jgi:hypothetical protein